MKSSQISHSKNYLNTISRRKCVILFGFLLGITCGLVFYGKQVKVYNCLAFLRYQQQNSNPAQISPDDQNRLRDIVNTLTSIVLSRSSLEEIINQKDIYTNLPDDMPMEGVVELMRNHIKIEPSPKGDTLSIEYEGSDPAKIVSVANALAEKFIEEDVRYQEDRASETLVYIQDELNAAKEMLDHKEVLMHDYRIKYHYEMPDQQARNKYRLIILQDQYSERQRSIRDLKKEREAIEVKITLQQQIVDENKWELQFRQAGEQQQATSIKIDQLAKLEMLRTDLGALQDEYGNQDPKVKRLKTQLVEVERLIEAEEQEKAGNLSEEKRQRNSGDELSVLQRRLNEINININTLEQKNEETKALIKKYGEWIASAPARETEWSLLTREYLELKRKYDSLLAQNLEAVSLLKLTPEREKIISRYIIESPARMPEAPIKPKFIVIMCISVLAGLLVGGAFAVGLERFDTTFKSKVELEHYLDLPIICSVPRLPLEIEIIKNRFWSVVKAGFFLIWVSALCVVLVFWGKEGKIVTPFMQILR